MGQWTAGLVAQEVREFLEADLDVFGSFIVVGEVGRVAPCVLRESAGMYQEGLPRMVLTRSWLYSFSNRCSRRAGSFAKSLRELADESGVWARRRDHWKWR